MDIDRITGFRAAWILTFLLAGTVRPAPGGAAPVTGIESIVVTARKIEERSQDAALSLIAFSATDLAQRGFKDISRIDEAAVNLQFDSAAPITGSSNAAEIHIRGVGQSDFLLTTEPGVGVYLDGVYVSRSVGGVQSLIDIDRVEVLRGPQGTLYGRNTIGGAINLISKKPAETPGAELQITTGSRNLVELFGAADLPIVRQTLLSRIAISKRERNGYVKRLSTAQKTGETDREGGRLSLEWRASDGVDVNLNLDGMRARNESVALTARWLEDRELFGRGALTDLYNTHVAPDRGEFYDARWLTDNRFDTNATGPSDSQFDIWGAAVIVDVDMNEFGLRSTTAYRDVDAVFGRDPDNSPLTIVHTENDYSHRQLSQELQVYSGPKDTGLNWVTGIHLFGEKGTDSVDVPLVDGLYEAMGVPFSVSGRTRIDNISAAVYGNIRYRVSGRWTLVGGLRYTYDKKKATVDLAYSDTGQALISDPDSRDSYTDISPKISVEYALGDTGIIYATAAKGFKSGGFTGRYVEPTANLLAFDPEEIVTYEVGFKSQWLNDKLRLNSAAFFSDYSDIQILIFDGVAPQTRNAAEGRIIGGELEAVYKPLRNITVTAGLGYLDARYTRLNAGVDDLVIPLTEDDKFVNTPEWSSNLSIEYTTLFRGDSELIWQVDYSYRSDIANDAINTPELVQNDVHLINARIQWTPENHPWRVSLFGRNLGDSEYIVSGAADKPTFGTLGVVYAPPLEWGLSVSLTL